MVSLGKKDAVAQLPFTTMTGFLPGLIKSRELFLRKTRKLLGLDHHSVFLWLHIIIIGYCSSSCNSRPACSWCNHLFAFWSAVVYGCEVFWSLNVHPTLTVTVVSWCNFDYHLCSNYLKGVSLVCRRLIIVYYKDRLRTLHLAERLRFCCWWIK